MPSNLRLFGFAHLCILAAVPLFAAILAGLQRGLPSGSKWLRVGLAGLLFLCSATYYGYFAVRGQLTFPDRLPLELCDASLLLVIAALLTLKAAVFDVAYYWALAGASMSLLTPNLPESPPLFLAVQYYADHGLIVAGALFLIWSGLARPRAGSVWRAMLALNGFAALVGAFDFFFKTDYMFLRAKPPTVSLLTFLGPWPWYILASEGVAVALFGLLYWPFRRGNSRAA